MAFTTLQIADATDTARTFAFYQDGSGNYYSTPVITDAAGHVLFTSGNPGVVSFPSAQAVTLSSTTITGSVAVTGTFFQATQPVSLTSTTITGSVAVTGTFFQATQPVSIASTLTTQDVSDGSVNGGTAGTKSLLSGLVYNSTPLTLTNGQQASLQGDSNGYLKVNVVTGGGSGGNAAASATGSAVPADAGYTGVSVSGTLTGVTGKTVGGVTGLDVDVNSVGGTALTLGQALSAASIPVVLPAAQITTLTPPTTVAVTQSTSPWVVSLTSTTITGTVAVTQSGSWSVTANAGTNLNTSALALETGGNLATLAGTVTAGKIAVNCTQTTSPWVVSLTSTTITGTVAATQSGTWNVGTVTTVAGVTTVSTVSAVTAITNALPAGTNTLGGVTAVGSATGGSLSYHAVGGASTNATNVKSSAGTLKSVQVYNISSSVAFLKFYNTSGTPAAGSGTPAKVIAIPGNTAGAGSNVILPPEGIAFGTGIGFTVTGGIADNDVSAITGNTVLIEIDYK